MTENTDERGQGLRHWWRQRGGGAKALLIAAAVVVVANIVYWGYIGWVVLFAVRSTAD